MAVVAITPARGGSVGIPRKNLRKLAGEPLIAHTISAAQGCGAIDRYVVNTEDDEIAAYARRRGVEVQSRPEDFWYDNTFQEVDRLLQWSVADLESRGAQVDIVVLLYATAPLRGPEPIAEAVEQVRSGGFDSSLSLYESRTYLWERLDGSGAVRPTNYDPATRGPNQLEGWNQWVENKALYVCRRDLLMESGCRLGGRIGHVVMDRLDSIDIDTPADLALAEALLASRDDRR